MVTLDIDKHDCENAATLMELYFFQNIRDDVDMDNINYIKSLIRVIDELNRCSK